MTSQKQEDFVSGLNCNCNSGQNYILLPVKLHGFFHCLQYFAAVDFKPNCMFFPENSVWRNGLKLACMEMPGLSPSYTKSPFTGSGLPLPSSLLTVIWKCRSWRNTPSDFLEWCPDGSEYEHGFCSPRIRLLAPGTPLEARGDIRRNMLRWGPLKVLVDKDRETTPMIPFSWQHLGSCTPCLGH